MDDKDRTRDGDADSVKKMPLGAPDEIRNVDDDKASASFVFDKTRRTLKNRHIQLIGIGGTVGTALFVQIGSSLTKGGPAEMVTWMPISSPFVRYADRFVDPALGFCAGVNFFVFETALIPFEIVAFNVVLQFWTDKIPTASVICFLLVAYCLLNVFAVRFYGESEFWLALGKAILAVGVIIFTFVTMVGGNPLHDAYGFRYWNPAKVQGAPFAEYIQTGSLGQFMGFLACLIQASFTIAGPDYVSMAAGEAHDPRRNMPQAFSSVFYRLTAFFILGSLCVGTVVPYNDPDLLHAISNAHPGAGASPYVIAMQHLKIPVLPHIMNALILSAVFSAGNSYVFCASRTLFGLALEGKAPRFLTRCTGSGVPIYCVALTLGISLISLLQLSNNAAVVIQWFVNLVTASQLMNYAIISFTYIRFHKALKAQGISRDSLPHKSFWQPFCGQVSIYAHTYYAFVATFTMAFVGGYTVFLPGRWDVPSFLFSYTMIAVVPLLFIYWKVRHSTEWQPLETMTFFEKERMLVDQYEEELHS
ncbi:General amino acid permease AGP2 [Psilocybe cubensis]|uniref:General amino acid permease AGP2 n=1 Tax=Psilocybe cubensis TaxID=181762 RepID=A0ACB8HB57_PSICU|nr:General amino acid permease AGP2 [Psilocybe cubensis]KAH9484385.1 General amino acid permease AGP2 [Psilocybe cubensis]